MKTKNTKKTTLPEPDYFTFAVSVILAALSKTPQQEIINIKKNSNSYKININGKVEITVKKL